MITISSTASPNISSLEDAAASIRQAFDDYVTRMGIDASTLELAGNVEVNTPDFPESEEDTPIELVEPEVTYPNFGEVIPDNLEEAFTTPVPENSGSILVQETTSRFSGAIWYEKVKEKTIVLAGLGGIGRF